MIKQCFDESIRKCIFVYMFIYEYIYMFVHTQGSDYFTEVITSHTVFSSLLFSHSTS